MRIQNQKLAYTLIEMSIAMVIVAILMGGAFSAAKTSINNSKIKITKDRFQQIYYALGAFVAANQRLPCPASLLDKKTDSTYGDEVGADTNCVTSGKGVYTSTTSANLVYGMVPAKALNVSSDLAEDGFGNKIAYVIDKRFARAPQSTPDFVNAATASFGTATFTNTIIIQEKPISSVTQNVNIDAIMVLISYGPNGYGAFKNTSATQKPASSDTDEQDNYPTNFNAAIPNPTAVYDNDFLFSSESNSKFEDVVFFKTRNNFVIDFGLMSLIACNIANAPGYGASSVYYGEQTKSTGCAVDGSVKIKKCGPFGAWIDVISACPI